LRQSPFKGRLLVCDMDGTLLDRSSKVSRENKAALERFTQGGGLFTLATGRMEISVMQYLKELPVNVPAILYNGASIYDFEKGKTLWEDNLEPDVIGPIKQAIEKFPGIGVQFYHGGRVYYVKDNEYMEAHRLREKFEPVRVGIDEVPQPWTKVIFEWHPAKLRLVEEFLNGFSEPFSLVYSEPQFLELLNMNTSKGNALRILTGLFGPEKPCVIAMGDNLNDVDLIKAADIGIAVENAHEKLKAAADMCCTRHDLNAVAEVIGWIEEGKIASVQ
jgi:Cof subfamily protein (haloacid dehalogenase superfamily)